MQLLDARYAPSDQQGRPKLLLIPAQYSYHDLKVSSVVFLFPRRARIACGTLPVVFVFSSVVCIARDDAHRTI
jgi:hypothetical protein